MSTSPRLLHGNALPEVPVSEGRDIRRPALPTMRLHQAAERCEPDKLHALQLGTIQLGRAAGQGPATPAATGAACTTTHQAEVRHVDIKVVAALVLALVIGVLLWMAAPSKDDSDYDDFHDWW